MTPFTVRYDGRERRVATDRDMREIVCESTRAAMLVDQAAQQALMARQEAFVRWGCVLMQLRPHIAEGTFKFWLADGGCKHRQKAYSAIGMAKNLDDGRGELDRDKLHRVIDEYNTQCAGRPGFKPLKAGVLTHAEIALGLRRDRRFDKMGKESGAAGLAHSPASGGRMVSGAAGHASPRVDIFDGPDVLDLHIKPVEPRVVAGVGGGGVAGVGGQQTTPSSVLLNRRAAEVNGGGPDSVSFLRPGRERDAGVSPASHGLPPALESRQRVQQSPQGNAAAPAGMRETSRPAVGGGTSFGGQTGPGGQASGHLGIETSRAIQAHAGDQRATQPVQLTLAGEYELAAKKATLLVERIASGHASPEIVRKLIALCEEAERGEMVAGGAA